MHSSSAPHIAVAWLSSYAAKKRIFFIVSFQRQRRKNYSAVLCQRSYFVRARQTNLKNLHDALG
ncbi:hypothetical protein EHW99_3622 [Erwinia amylovora]|nr:hypothetical protein EHX00_3622 [Erwinia amylovora]QJQ60020.1 hypothetical protein EHW99_3622 [Erwinia amylovora]QJQ63719.1 hypothetical protein EHW98_3622 [Erwinia amylovora]QJQ67521.1 hypothetical protein EHW96_3622 [Erwinia amylovora]QJQ71220.1 hypothetical protein EGZ89_3622 [Erwinia amylovora]